MPIIFALTVFIGVWVTFRNEPWFRRLLGMRAFGKPDSMVLSNDQLTGIIAKSGSGLAPEISLDRVVHRSTWGVRLLTPTLGVILAYVLFQSVAVSANLPSYWKWGMWSGIGIGVYTTVFIWAYRIEVGRDQIWVMSPTFVMREYPLAQLVEIDEDGPYAWQFHFRDRRMVRVTKTVVGLNDLRQFLGDTLEANARG